MTAELIEAIGTWIVLPLAFVALVYIVTRQR